jgi:DNA-binding response OmpR family regulator
MKALIVEDDHKILKFVTKGLKEGGFIVDTADDGKDGIYLAQTNEYDIIILDWMLPNFTGVQIAEQLRQQKIITPILMLTAKSDLDDKIASLEAGIDDYMTKPFSFRELIARINSLIRRSTYKNEDVIKIDTLEVNIIKRIVKRSNRGINLTTKEFDILVYMLQNLDSIVTHTQLQEKIWGIDEVTSSNVINVFVHHLRKKIDTDDEEPLITTVRNSGYKIVSFKT